MRAELRAIPGGSSPVSVLSASADLERAWVAVRDAADAFVCSALGDTDQLFRHQAEWTAAIVRYESARLKLTNELARVEGRAWLKVVPNV